MKRQAYRSMPPDDAVARRDFLKAGALGAGLVMAGRSLFASQQAQSPTPPAKPAGPPPRPQTNIEDALKVPRTQWSLPGPFPGRVVEVHDPAAMPDGKVDAAVVRAMVEKGIRELTGKSLKKSFGLFFTKKDIVGLKVNPVGPGLISTRLEVVDAVIDWLTSCGLQRRNIIIWDRFDYMLRDAGFTAQRFPGVGIEGLQTMDEAAAEGKTQDNSKWLAADGTHVSAPNFDRDVFYWADVEGPKDLPYLNQHVFNGKHSYFGKLLTKKLTKIVNLPAFKNTGNAISMATKNIGFGAICNTNRLHKPLFLNVNTEVHAFPVIRDKLVLNITDALRAQYDGGPDAAASFIYSSGRIFLATDPFALDLICQRLINEKRKSMGVKVNENPLYTEYLRYGERLGLGIADPARIQHVTL